MLRRNGRRPVAEEPPDKNERHLESGLPVGHRESSTGGHNRTRLAFLATLGHLHTEPLKYDLECLRSIIEQVEPDLLGIEAEPEEWEQGSLGGAPVEVGGALMPASAVTDAVIVPLGGPLPAELAPPGEGRDRGGRVEQFARARAGVLRTADRLLEGWQRDRAAQGPEAVNSRFFRHLCGLVCSLEEMTADEAGKRAWEEVNGRILERILEMVRRDPGRRVLVAVNCRRVHWLESRLQPFASELELVPYDRL
jgi:hypothetical protein